MTTTRAQLFHEIHSAASINIESPAPSPPRTASADHLQRPRHSLDYDDDVEAGSRLSTNVLDDEDVLTYLDSLIQ